MLANKKWLQSNQTKGGVLVIYIVCPEKKQYVSYLIYFLDYFLADFGQIHLVLNKTLTET